MVGHLALVSCRHFFRSNRLTASLPFVAYFQMFAGLRLVRHQPELPRTRLVQRALDQKSRVCIADFISESQRLLETPNQFPRVSAASVMIKNLRTNTPVPFHRESPAPTALKIRLHDFPVEAAANPFKQFPVVKPKHWLTRLCIDCQPAALCARVSHYFNFSHLIPLTSLTRKSSCTSPKIFKISASSSSPSSGLPRREKATAPVLASLADIGWACLIAATA